MPDNNPPGIPLADEVCFMNIANPDEVAKKAANLKLDGVATCCLDTGISALGKTCDSLGLTGLPEKAAIMCLILMRNKVIWAFFKKKNKSELH